MSELAARSCPPCRGGMPPLSATECKYLLGELGGGWQLVGPGLAVQRLAKAFRTRNFETSLDWATKIGAVAAEQNHHPDLQVSWGLLRVEVFTHKVGGLTEADFVLAAKIDTIFAQL